MEIRFIETDSKYASNDDRTITAEFDHNMVYVAFECMQSKCDQRHLHWYMYLINANPRDFIPIYHRHVWKRRNVKAWSIWWEYVKQVRELKQVRSGCLK